MLTNFNYLLKDAIKKNYAIGIIEVWDNYTIKAAVEAGIEENSPTALLAGQNFIEGIEIKQFADMAISYIEETELPVALCLDECQDFDFIIKCIKAGFSFVMHEGGSGEYGGKKQLSFSENVEITRQIVRVAHAAGVTVEASLGEMPLSKGGEAGDLSIQGGRTDPEQAVQFVRKTGIDILAPSVGNIHCVYKNNWPEPDWDLASEIIRKVDIPCSLHGGSGASDEQLRKAISIGFKKINIGTRYNEIYRKALLKELDECEGLGCPFNSGEKAADSVKEESKRLMREVYRSSDKFRPSNNNYWSTEKLSLSGINKQKPIFDYYLNYKEVVDSITQSVLKEIESKKEN